MKSFKKAWKAYIHISLVFFLHYFNILFTFYVRIIVPYYILYLFPSSCLINRISPWYNSTFIISKSYCCCHSTKKNYFIYSFYLYFTKSFASSVVSGSESSVFYAWLVYVWTFTSRVQSLISLCTKDQHRFAIDILSFKPRSLYLYRGKI